MRALYLGACGIFPLIDVWMGPAGVAFLFTVKRAQVTSTLNPVVKMHPVLMGSKAHLIEGDQA